MNTNMKTNMLLAALFLGVGLALVLLTGWFGVLLGVISLLLGLVLALRGVRQMRAARAA
jgi:hypothetical protein